MARALQTSEVLETSEVWKKYNEMASDVRHKLRIVLWVGPENADEWGPTCPGHTEWKHTLSQVDPVLVKRPFFLPYVAFRDYGDYCDVFGNLLAVLFGVWSADASLP